MIHRFIIFFTYKMYFTYLFFISSYDFNYQIFNRSNESCQHETKMERFIRNMNGIRGAVQQFRETVRVERIGLVLRSFSRFFLENVRRAVSPMAISDVQNGALDTRHTTQVGRETDEVLFAASYSHSRSRYTRMCARLTNRHADRDVNY